MAKKGILKKVAGFALCVAVAASVYTGFLIPELVYNSKHQIFNCEKVSNDMEYYGASELYSSDASSITLINNRLVKHFDTGHNDKIVVGYGDSMTEEDVLQCDYFINYLNGIFDIINPDYNFISKRATHEESDIFIEFNDIAENDNDLNVTLANSTRYTSLLNNSIINSAEITFNRDKNLNNVQKRFLLAHEFLHILTGANDLNITDENYDVKGYPLSVFDYYMGGKIMYDIYYSYDPSESKSLSDLYLPMDKEIKESWVSYMPFDLSALISIYGDSSTEENRQKYLDLLNDTMTECDEIFSNRYTSSYYYDGFSLPTIDEKNTPIKSEKSLKKNENNMKFKNVEDVDGLTNFYQQYVK